MPRARRRQPRLRRQSPRCSGCRSTAATPVELAAKEDQAENNNTPVMNLRFDALRQYPIALMLPVAYPPVNGGDKPG